MKQLSSSLPLNTTLQPNTLLPTRSPIGLSAASSAKPTSIGLSAASSAKPTISPTGLSAASSTKTPLTPSAEIKSTTIGKTNLPNGAKTPSQTGGSNKQNTQHEMERLKGLGLTVSVDQVLKSPAPQSSSVGQVSGEKAGASGQKEVGGSGQVASSNEKKPIAMKQTSTTAASYSTAQKLQLKSQVGYLLFV